MMDRPIALLNSFKDMPHSNPVNLPFIYLGMIWLGTEDLEEKGFRVYAAVQERNVPQIRATMKASSRQIEKARLFGLLGIRAKKVVK